MRGKKGHCTFAMMAVLFEDALTFGNTENALTSLVQSHQICDHARALSSIHHCHDYVDDLIPREHYDLPYLPWAFIYQPLDLYRRRGWIDLSLFLLSLMPDKPMSADTWPKLCMTCGQLWIHWLFSVTGLLPRALFCTFSSIFFFVSSPCKVRILRLKCLCDRLSITSRSFWHKFCSNWTSPEKVNNCHKL